MNATTDKFFLFCLGYGYVAAALAEAVMREGWRCAGTCRDEEKCRTLCVGEVELFKMARGFPLQKCNEAFAGATHILVSVPPDTEGDLVLDLHGGDIELLNRVKWIGYLSTTGVYGNRDGHWVDEWTPICPTSERGRRRAEAESKWLDLGRRTGIPVHVFRLAGIYGPGRNPIARLRAGSARRIRREGQVFGRIHVNDIVTTLRASAAQPTPGMVYNVTDDEPAPPDVVVAYAAQLLGAEPPALEQFETAEMSAMARTFYTENKRVSNNRIKKELGVMLKYPNYRVGLDGLL